MHVHFLSTNLKKASIQHQIILSNRLHCTHPAPLLKTKKSHKPKLANLFQHPIILSYSTLQHCNTNRIQLRFKCSTVKFQTSNILLTYHLYINNQKNKTSKNIQSQKQLNLLMQHNIKLLNVNQELSLECLQCAAHWNRQQPYIKE